MKFNKLILCLFPTVLAATSLANTINLSPGENVAQAVASAHSGDTVIFGSGTYNLNSPFIVPSGVTVTGISPSDSHIVFNLSGGNSDSYGVNLAGNASNVTIEQLDFHSNHGVIRMAAGDPYTDHFSNITITHNNFQYGGGDVDGSIVYGISGTMVNDGLQITHNYFHDSQNSNRNWCVFYASNSHFDYNLFYNIEDGGQIQYPGPNVTFSYNYGTMIHRMAQESAAVPKTSMSYVGNVFYDWYEPYPDSFGMSIVHDSGEINYSGNYLRASIAPGSSWGSSDGSGVHRFGFAFESTGYPCNVSGNTFIGSWASFVCSDGQTSATQNQLYGAGLWGNFTGETGGRISASSNSGHSVNSAPPPPPNTFAGPDFGSEESTSSAKNKK